MKDLHRRKILRRTQRPDFGVRPRSAVRDGIFEGIRVYNGRVFKLKEHIDRLFCSAKSILLDLPLAHAHIMAAIVETCRRNKLRDGYIRLVVTRGPGTLGLNPNRCKNPSLIIIADKIQLYPRELYQQGMEIVTVPTTRNLHSALKPGDQIVELPQQHPGQDRGQQCRLRGSHHVECRRLRGRMHRR